MVSAAPRILTNAWVKASWEEYVAIADAPDNQTKLEKAQFYYDSGFMRIENMTTGFSHGRNHSLLASAINLYGTLQDLNFIALDNATFRKSGERDCQPDLAYYLNGNLPEIPPGNNPVNVNLHGAPTLAIEISASTIDDDLGKKRLLYERLGVKEYWVVDVEKAEIIAFAIADGRSGEIRTSNILQNLQIAVLEEALQRIQSENDGAVSRWLLKQFA